MKRYLIGLDQGSTQSRAVLFDSDANIITASHRKFAAAYPKPGWINYSPNVIWETLLQCLKDLFLSSNISPKQIATIGLTTQRGSAMLWHRETGQPVGNAIGWQCLRTSEMCRRLTEEGMAELIKQRTGLKPDAVFSATKIKWLLENHSETQELIKNGLLCCGNLDSWLLFKLTGLHATDHSNASFSMLYNIKEGCWDKEMLNLFAIPESIMPEIRPSYSDFGKLKAEFLDYEIPVNAVVGDQSATLYAQSQETENQFVLHYTTGCFCSAYTAQNFIKSENMLTSVVAWHDESLGNRYMIGGGVFFGGGLIQWLRDKLQLFANPDDIEKLAKEVESTDGVILVPAFFGLGAPYWEPTARGAILGLNARTTKAHLARAALEGIAFRCADIFFALEQELGVSTDSLRVAGKAAENQTLLQFQANLVGVPVMYDLTEEAAALGCAMLAGKYQGISCINDVNTTKTVFPRVTYSTRQRLLDRWRSALDAVRLFKV